MSRLLAALVILMAAGASHAQDRPSPRPGSLAKADVAKRIAALETTGGSDAWDDEVKEIFLAAFDADRSGEIDSNGELNAIPCEVWRTVDKSIRSGSPDSGLAWTYGFKPDFEWVGDAFAIAEKLRKASFARIQACGIDIGK